MGFIDHLRDQGHAVESICRVLREQGCQVAARTYRAWRSGRVAARTVTDAMVVGRTLGVDALAAVGATGSLLFLLLGFAFGMTSGFAIPTAQAFGAGDLAADHRPSRRCSQPR